MKSPIDVLVLSNTEDATRSIFSAAMKTFIAIVLVAAIVCIQANEHEEQVKDKKIQFKKECIESSKVDPDVIDKSRKGDFADDAKFKEYLFCFYQKLGALNESGVYQLEAMLAKLTSEYGDEIAKNVVAACTEKTYGNPLETAYELARCCYAKTPKKEVKV